MTRKIRMNEVRTLLEATGYHGSFELHPLTGGVNNRIFLVRRDDQILAVLKQYYHHEGNLRDRLSSDYGFSQFLWNHGIHQIPQPLASDSLHHLALFTYINGKKMIPSEITGPQIDQVLGFYFAINSCRVYEDARLLPKASEACFSLADHILLTENRVRNLQKIKGRSETDKRAGQFIQDELFPMWERIKCTACQTAEEDDLVPDEKILDRDMRLSPSDFGFHNVLAGDEGTLSFMDFEYAGWDDPSKMVCDLFCQPEIPVPRRFHSYISEKIVKDLSDPDMQSRKIAILLPVYKIKWCCIILNEFLPRGRSRRAFMKKTLDPELRKDEQLQKAMNIIATIKER